MTRPSFQPPPWRGSQGTAHTATGVPGVPCAAPPHLLCHEAVLILGSPVSPLVRPLKSPPRGLTPFPRSPLSPQTGPSSHRGLQRACPAPDRTRPPGLCCGLGWASLGGVLVDIAAGVLVRQGALGHRHLSSSGLRGPLATGRGAGWDWGGVGWGLRLERLEGPWGRPWDPACLPCARPPRIYRRP